MKLLNWLLGSARVEKMCSIFGFQKGGNIFADKINKKEDVVQGAAVNNNYKKNDKSFSELEEQNKSLQSQNRQQEYSLLLQNYVNLF